MSWYLCISGSFHSTDRVETEPGASFKPIASMRSGSTDLTSTAGCYNQCPHLGPIRDKQIRKEKIQFFRLWSYPRLIDDFSWLFWNYFHWNYKINQIISVDYARSNNSIFFPIVEPEIWMMTLDTIYIFFHHFNSFALSIYIRKVAIAHNLINSC